MPEHRGGRGLAGKRLRPPAGPSAASERDPIAEAHLIARTAPGLGNPLDLTCAEFDRHLDLSMAGGEIGGFRC